MSLNHSLMDVDGENSSRTNKRRKGSSKRKLLVKEKVELKSLEEGFQGSWHPGTVVRCERQKRYVKYDNILDDDESKYMVDVVDVSAVLDGLGSSSDWSNEPGLIRPLPPLLAFGERDLPFGLCVDVNYEEAWWEGVIFDHWNGMDERSVLFPDLGDEMKVGIHQLRITQDWDEATENWEPRGKWVFLEVIEECEKESTVAVSLKQIWYDVRATKEFDNNIKHWTCNVKELWSDLVKEVVGDYYVLTLEHVLPALNLPEDFLKETPDLKSRGIIPLQGECNKDPLVDGASEKEIILQEEPVSPVQEIMPSASCCGKKRKRRLSGSICWKPLVLTEVEFCPDVINEYIRGVGSKTVRDLLKTKVRKHLTYLGWKIEWAEDKYFPGRGRYRYIPPDDAQDRKVYTSIIKVLTHLQMGSSMNNVPLQIDHNRVHSTNDTNLSHLLSDLIPNDQDVHVCPPKGKPSHVKVAVEPEFCPQAVVKYYLNASQKQWVDRGKWRLKAKKHLLAEGWTLNYPTKKRKTTLYRSPQSRYLGLLLGACKTYIEEKIPEWTNSGMIPSNFMAMNENVIAHVDSDDLSQNLSELLKKEPKLFKKEPELLTVSPASRSTENRNLRRTKKSKASMPKSERKGLPSRVLRSSKRVQKVSAPSLTHQRPQNVLAWLIDNSMVMPRYKVYCWEGGSNTNVVEGRITYDGIKCSCCHIIYGLGGFVNHAGGNGDCRPSASIFLKDGRSLLDCMIKVMHDHRTREDMNRTCTELSEGENDNICSVCQYGGELILCDRCPSAFHSTCIGLEDIPDGEWCCPSCRCGICGGPKTEATVDGDLLDCIQCEHKYHIGCLRDREKLESRPYMENWLCGKECEQIHANLQSLVGKPLIVGANNLTWTLVKFIDSESRDVNGTKNDLLAEKYSKLRVALSVMHECFEPLENPLTHRDIIDDVIFNTRSHLNRLNFGGFYTVLLEQNEELISVATIRVFGRKVAEVPLVGTRIQYRRLGMCRILMNELEKRLSLMGVERLVLPAVPVVLDTWTNGFGFSRMTNFERSQFLDCGFLDFQETVMCQKLMTRSPSPQSGLTRDMQQPKLHDIVNLKCKVEFDKSSSASKVDQEAEKA